MTVWGGRMTVWGGRMTYWGGQVDLLGRAGFFRGMVGVLFETQFETQ